MKKDKICHQQVITLYLEEKLSMEAIGRIVGCSYTTIKTILVANNIPLRSASESQKLRRYDSAMKHDAQLKAQLIELYCEKEMNYEECVKELGISPAYVGQLLSFWGVPRRGRPYHIKIDKLPADTIIHAYTELGHSLDEIAREYSVSQGLIPRLLDNHGIKRRTLSEAKKMYWKKWKEKREANGQPEATETDIPDGTLEEQVRFLREEKDMMVQDIAATLSIEPASVYDVLFN